MSVQPTPVTSNTDVNKSMVERKQSMLFVQEHQNFDDTHQRRGSVRSRPRRSVFDDDLSPIETLNDDDDKDPDIEDEANNDVASLPNNKNEVENDELVMEEQKPGYDVVKKVSPKTSAGKLDVHVPHIEEIMQQRRSSLNTPVGHELIFDIGDLDEDDLDSSLLDKEAVSYLDQKELPKQKDFFEELGSVPDMDQISVDPSMRDEIDRHRRPRFSELDGHYVDPLTGERLPSEESTADMKEVSQVKVETAKEETAAEMLEHEIQEEFSELKLPSSVDEEDPTVTVTPVVAAAERMLETFFLLPPEKETKFQKHIDFGESEQDEEYGRLEKTVTQFIGQIIDRVVERCEYIDPAEYLRNNLDMMKLYNQLKKLISQLFTEKRVNEFVSRQAVVYFRRKKNFRAIVEDPNANAELENEKLESAYKHFDILMGRAQATEEKSSAIIEKLEEEVEEWEKKTEDEVTKLYDFMKQTILRQPSQRLSMVLERECKHMSSLRKEISAARFTLIQRQHTIATLKDKASKLETIGPNLMMSDFENLQRETTALDKKIEERNAELIKLQLRYHSDLHIMAHMRETQKMLGQTLDRQQYVLDIFQLEKQTLRERIHELKLERGRLRDQIRDLSFQGGLIDKPALMYDYDTTAQRLAVLQSKVERMRAKFAALQKKVNLAEGVIDDHEMTRKTFRLSLDLRNLSIVPSYR